MPSVKVCFFCLNAFPLFDPTIDKPIGGMETRAWLFARGLSRLDGFDVKFVVEQRDPSQIGVGMATALLTTLYGAVVANLFCIPLAGKLENRSKEEVMIRELMVAGLVALVEGQPPRTVQDRLMAFLSPSLVKRFFSPLVPRGWR